MAKKVSIRTSSLTDGSLTCVYYLGSSNLIWVNLRIPVLAFLQNNPFVNKLYFFFRVQIDHRRLDTDGEAGNQEQKADQEGGILDRRYYRGLLSIPIPFNSL